MAESYSRDHLKLSVAKVLQTLGWHSINTTPLEVLTDLLCTFITDIGKTTSSFANEFGQVDPNLDHLGLAFREVGVDLQELEEYVRYVNFGHPPAPVPKFPVPKEDHLNFLKPGSKEVVTRPVHIHEHLPPMHPILEGADTESEVVTLKQEVSEELVQESAQVFKKPADVSPDFKRASCRKEEESSRPTREISSVMMTTSGFLSPAREGKLPESRTPLTPVEPVAPPPPQVPEVIEQPKKPVKVLKKPDKKRDRVGKELFKPLVDDKKKPPSMKDIAKIKQKNNLLNSLPNGTEVKISQMPITPKQINHQNKANKALAAARLKTGKLNTTITPIPMTIPDMNQSQVPRPIDKLLTEPTREKLNNLKKIFKDVKGPKKDDKLESRGSSPALVIDMPPDEIASKISSLPCDVTIEPINVAPVKMSNSPDKLESTYFDTSPPGTPSAPKTPEIVTHSPPIIKQKHPKKVKVRRTPKQQPIHPMEQDIIDLGMERPKTPEAHMPLPKQDSVFNPLPQVPLPLTYPFAPFGGPGLIPPPLLPTPLATNPMFPFNLGRMPFMPMPGVSQLGLRGLSNFGQPMKMEEPPAKVEAVEKLAPPPPVHHKPPVIPPTPPQPQLPPAPVTPQPSTTVPSPHLDTVPPMIVKPEKKTKEHKKDKKDKLKKKNKKDKIKSKSEKKKLKIEKKDKDKIKKEKKEKRKEKEMQMQQFKEGESPVPKITLKLGSPSSRPATPEMKRLNIKPIIKRDDEPSVVSSGEERKREPSPGLAKIAALVTGPPKPRVTNPVTAAPVEEIVREEPSVAPVRNHPGPGRPRIHPIKPKPPVKPKKRRASVKKDEDGNEVWFCPACGKLDDGSPMIGCDDCDSWYHWVCVGIRMEPDEHENWYCRDCLMKKNEILQNDKKKKRKKREKKEH